MDLEKLARREMAGAVPDRRAQQPISTGSLTLDIELGGGFNRGEVTTIYYQDHVDPWPLLLTSLRLALAEKLSVGIISVLPPDPQVLKSGGVEPHKILVACAGDLEEVEEALGEARRARFDILIIDTLNAIDTGENGLLNWMQHQALTTRMRSGLRLPRTAVVLMRIPPRKYRGGVPKYAKEDETALIVTRTKGTKTRLHIISRGSTLPRASLEIPTDPHNIDHERELAKLSGMRLKELREAMEKEGGRVLRTLKG